MKHTLLCSSSVNGGEAPLWGLFARLGPITSCEVVEALTRKQSCQCELQRDTLGGTEGKSG